MGTEEIKKNSTEEGEKVEMERSITRRAAIKAGWAVPVILAIGLGGNAFVHATPTSTSRGTRTR